MAQVRMRQIFACLLCMTLLSACSASDKYSGDGRMVDNGVTAANERYVVELGYVDLTKIGSHTFRIAGLPKANFVIGLQIPVVTTNGAEAAATTTADVSIKLIGPTQEIIVDVAGPLSEWTWSGPLHATSNFIYKREPLKSYFDATPSTEYHLRVDVRTVDRATGTRALVVLKSGGWK
jgi:hypothetical protein